MVEKKEKVISTRVNETLYNFLQRKADEHGVKPSNFIRDALVYYVKFVDFHEKANNPMLLFSKSEVAFIISQLNDEGLENLADICYQNGILTRQQFVKEFSKDPKLEDVSVGLRAQISYLNKLVFSKEGQYWLNDVSTKFKEKEFRFGGKHDLNINFSKFLKYFMKKHLAVYFYELVEEDLKDDRCILVFRKV